ncbi:MAG: hypothetical protein SH868_08575 [Bythopirellula sp.]|nr:hypothetical protein [Bythopirellula sp.]
MNSMNEELQSLTQAALLFAAVFVLTAIGIAIVRRFRGGRADDMAESSEMMTKFRELHDEGGLSDEEFRTIKSKLARNLRAELKEISAPAGSKSAGS